MKKLHPMFQGFIELYLAVGLFLILALGMSLAVEYKMREIKTEKTAWLAQAHSWEKSRNNQKILRDDPELISLLQKGYRQTTPLHIEKIGILNREQDTLIPNGLVRAIATTVDLLTTYIRCPEQLEPLSLLAFKHIVHPHGQSRIIKTFHPTLHEGVSTFMNVTAMDQHKAVYQEINRTFTGTDIGDTGWLLRQLLWQEAVGKSDFGHLMPLQLLGIFECSKRIAAVLTKDPGIFSILKREKIRKAKHLIRKDILGSMVFETLANKLEEYTQVNHNSRFDSQTCQSLSEPTQ